MAHIHDMDATPEVTTSASPGHWPRIHKCLSCEFRCTAAKLAEVKANPGRHRLVRKKDPQAKVVYGVE